MNSKYIVNGSVARSQIAMDIKYRVLKRDSIVALCQNGQIKDAFIGTSFSAKTAKKDWNKEYLHLLSYAVVAESFNLDYLLYLDEVAEYVSQAKFKKIVVAGIIVVLVIIGGVVVLRYIL